MVLRYMVSDTDLTRGKVTQPQREVVQPKKNISLPKRRVKFWLLLLANMILLIYVCYRWVPRKCIPTPKFFTNNKIIVSGIMYYAENPSAIICGEVVREGDEINGYKVVKIHKEKVELEKDGKYLIKRVR
jgi:hypothetical protein